MSQAWHGEMPSNIALIKYMGKKDVEKNIPTNDSISWTLNHLTTQVEIKEVVGSEDRWEPLESHYPFEMSTTGYEKFIKHFQKIKTEFGVGSSFVIRSSNNFPADCGIASSASSFAALTEVSCQAFSELTGQTMPVSERAKLSARGSGSSCRSFLNDWVLWEETGIRNFECSFKNLGHMVLLAGHGAKKVSSSQAHKKVKTSLLFDQRVQRCQQRLTQLLSDLQDLKWSAIYQNVWAEFWDMHSLFETSSPAFGYFLPDSITILNSLRQHWEEKGDGPLVTMDAGPNVHLLWRDDQQEQALSFFNEVVKNRWTCLSNIKEVGFAQV